MITLGMHRLFWKLFVTYWIALILFALGSLIAVSFYLEHTHARHDSASPMEEYDARIQQARLAAATGGKPGLREWATRLDAEELVPFLVLDREGRDLLQRDVPPRALGHLQRYLERARSHAPHDERRHAIRLPDGSEYWLVPDFQGATLGRFLSRPKVIVLPLIMAALASGLVGLLLARYLTSPMERLRQASQAYAAGDFSRRVGPSLGSRRDEIVDLACALDNMAAQLDVLLKSQRGLLRDVSHELRSPLARVQAALGLARQRSTGAESELDRIDRETERLNDLIGAILTFSRLDTGVHPFTPEMIDLGLMLEDMAEDARLEGAARGIRIDDVQQVVAPCLGDPVLLHSVLENILRNAILHSPDGGLIKLTLTDETDETGRIDHVVRILDQGPGVPEDMLESIFDPFVRVDAARGRNSGGVGLGLAIARRAIQAQHGTIRAENHPQGGLLVTLRLPLSPCHPLHPSQQGH
ncbi:MAG: HAMP domain-containing protein [Thiobacillus sp.]|nr:HAMP domain-containing protein [Thiobacillus sp.]